MAKLLFNGATANQGIPLLSYNRNTSVGEGGQVVSQAYAQLDSSASTASYLTGLLTTGITRIQIRNDENQVVYDLDDITATLTSISETWNGQTVDIYININVDTSTPAQTNPTT